MKQIGYERSLILKWGLIVGAIILFFLFLHYGIHQLLTWKRITLNTDLFLFNNVYHNDQNIDFVRQLKQRIRIQPFNLIAFGIFILAIVHAFCSHKFRAIAHRIEKRHRDKVLKADGRDPRFQLDKKTDVRLERDTCFSAEVMHFLSEVEVVFGIWLIPLMLSLTYFFDWKTAVYYLESRDYTEPLFVIVVMTLASTRPIVKFAEKMLSLIAGLWNKTPAAWWLTLLSIGPLLGSLITEPAAMTLCALLLSKQFYDLKPSSKLAYATLGLLFVNISVGGVLTHFAAPPVIMVAKGWNWSMPFMFQNFGWKAIIGIGLANTLYYFHFRHELSSLQALPPKKEQKEHSVPIWITIVHLSLLTWTVVQNHHPALFIATFLFFIAFYEATAPHQSSLTLRTPILVGTFLAGLVIHGGLQGWWIEIILSKVSDTMLMISAAVLTAFNDNAAITYLATVIPEVADKMKYAIVAGAVTGGGLTIIANAPNPAGQAILNRHFKDGISPTGLLLGAVIPTIIMGLCFGLL